MIDEARLAAAYDSDGFYSLQLEVGDRCEQNCCYCYLNALPDGSNTLSDAEITQVLDDAASLGVTAIEWLGGEPLLHESIFTHMNHAARAGLRNNLWTGGLPLAEPRMIEQCLEACAGGLISVHVSSVDPETYLRLHPGRPPTDLPRVLDAVSELVDVGYPPDQLLNSVTFTGLQTAEDMIATIDHFETRFGVKTSLNVYHTYLRPGTDPGALTRYIPSPDAVAAVYRRYADQYGVEELPLNCVNKQYCSATLAVLCDGSVTPCATIRPGWSPNVHDRPLRVIAREVRPWLIFAPMKTGAALPAPCRSCELADSCWGCRSRAYAAARGIHGMDPRCYKNKNL